MTTEDRPPVLWGALVLVSIPVVVAMGVGNTLVKAGKEIVEGVVGAGYFAVCIVRGMADARKDGESCR